MKNTITTLAFIILSTSHLVANANHGKIKIYDAQYGDFHHDRIVSVKDLVSDKCHDQEECDFIINNSFTQTDPCRGLPKRMIIKCSCDDNTEVTINKVELAHISIRCIDHELVVEDLRRSPYLFTTPVVLAGCVTGSYIGYTTTAAPYSCSSTISNTSIYGFIGGYLSARVARYFVYAREAYYGRV